MSLYRFEVCRSMELLGKQSNSFFIGQSVEYPGTAMYGTLLGVPKEKKLELPVAEDMQLGMAIGMSLNGILPICIYPRINFLLLAMDQLILHLDKIPEYSDYRPKVIIRTGVANGTPLDPGPQHLGDFYGLDEMLKNVIVYRLHDEQAIYPAYVQALASKKSWLLIEDLGRY